MGSAPSCTVAAYQALPGGWSRSLGPLVAVGSTTDAPVTGSTVWMLYKPLICVWPIRHSGIPEPQSLASVLIWYFLTVPGHAEATDGPKNARYTSCELSPRFSDEIGTVAAAAVGFQFRIAINAATRAACNCWAFCAM